MATSPPTTQNHISSSTSKRTPLTSCLCIQQGNTHTHKHTHTVRDFPETSNTHTHTDIHTHTHTLRNPENHTLVLIVKRSSNYHIKKTLDRADLSACSRTEHFTSVSATPACSVTYLSEMSCYISAWKQIFCLSLAYL